MTKLNFFNRQSKPGRLVLVINDYADQSRKSRAYKRRYRDAARKIENFEKTHKALYTDSLTLSVFESILEFLKSEYSLRPSTLKSFSGSMSKVINYARQSGYAVNDNFKEVRIVEEEAASIYLTDVEIERIYELKIKEQNVDTVRNRFLIGCYTGLRHSDYSKLNRENFTPDSICIKTQKTGAKVVIPIHWMVQEIFDRYNGSLPVLKSQQSFNRVIKNICKRAKINSDVLVERTVGNKVERKKYKKYQLVSSHTARRSFATNMYLAGIETAKIMLITGHKTESSFFKYIRISKHENAKELSQHPFFRKK